MDGLFEILIPLVFFALYFLSSFFSKKDKEEEWVEPEPDTEEMRKTREELQRRIQERKEENQAGQTMRGRDPETAVTEKQGGRLLRENQPMHRMQDRREDRRDPSPSPTAKPPVQVYDSEYWEKELEEKMLEVEQTRMRADSLREETLKKSTSPSSTRRTAYCAPSSSGSSSYAAFLKQSLDNPENLRRSFILYEVFGTPVGARRHNEIRPSWDL
jgi:hypothetical protein